MRQTVDVKKSIFSQNFQHDSEDNNAPCFFFMLGL